jgi:uncharacterized protein YkwD
MKYHFLGTFCALLAVIGIAASTAHADVSISIPNDADVEQEDSSEPAETQAERAPKSTPVAPMNSIELATYNLVNKYRQTRNLPPLVADPDISAQAKAHSERMARSGNMSHDGFNDRVASVAKTIVYRNAAENVAYNMGYGQPDLVAVQGWIESPGHKKNMIGQFDLTGIGVARGARGEYYFTQIFIRKAFYVKDAD